MPVCHHIALGLCLFPSWTPGAILDFWVNWGSEVLVMQKTMAYLILHGAVLIFQPTRPSFHYWKQGFSEVTMFLYRVNMETNEKGLIFQQRLIFFVSYLNQPASTSLWSYILCVSTTLVHVLGRKHLTMFIVHCNINSMVTATFPITNTN